MSTEIIIAVLSGIVSGVVGGWVSGRQASKREIAAITASAKRDLSSTASQGDNSPNVGGGRASNTLMTTGDYSPIAHGVGAHAIAGDLNLHDKAAHLTLKDTNGDTFGSRRLTISNVGLGAATDVKFEFEFHHQAGGRFQPVPNRFAPYQDYEVGQYRVFRTSDESPTPPHFWLTWRNPDGSEDRTEIPGVVA